VSIDGVAKMPLQASIFTSGEMISSKIKTTKFALMGK